MQSFTHVFKKALFITALCTLLIPSGVHAATLTKTPTVMAVDEEPSVTLIAPNGGESFTEGQQITVRWSTTGIPTTQKVGFDLYTNQDTIKGYTLFNVAGQDLFDNDGQETLVIPSIRNNFTSWNYGNYFTVKMSVDNPNIDAVDYSDSTFAINPSANATCTINSFTASPTTVSAGAIVDFSWNTNCANTGIKELDGFPTKNFVTSGTTNAAVTTTTTFTLFASNNPGCAGTVYSTTTGAQCTYTTASTTVTVATSPQTPTITVLSPNGGEVYDVGAPISMTWTSYNPQNLMLQAQFDSVTNPGYSHLFIPDLRMTDDGSEIANIPADLPPGKYKLRIGMIGTNQDITDSSNEPFTIKLPGQTICDSNSTPSITVLSPNGGEVYQAGQQITVTWKSCNVGNVVLSLVKDPFNPEIEDGINLTGAINNDGSEMVTLPSAQIFVSNSYPITYGRNFRIYVYRAENYNSTAPLNDLSDNLFTIQASTTPLPAGCTSTAGYSTTSGQPCNLPEGCMAPTGFSTITGQPCTANGGRPVRTPSVGPDPVATKTSFTRELKLGASGADVTALQTRLKSEGVYTSPITGYFGKMTQAALKKFQTKYGIPAVGAAGPRTLQALNK